MIDLPQIRNRVVRLRELAEGLSREVNAQKAAEGVLLRLERRRYLDAMQNALRELDDARHVLTQAVGRMEREGR